MIFVLSFIYENIQFTYFSNNFIGENVDKNASYNLITFSKIKLFLFFFYINIFLIMEKMTNLFYRYGFDVDRLVIWNIINIFLIVEKVTNLFYRNGFDVD